MRRALGALVVFAALGILACGSSESSDEPAGQGGSTSQGGNAGSAGVAGSSGKGGAAGSAGTAGASGKDGGTAGAAGDDSGTAGAAGDDSGTAGTAGDDSGAAGTGGDDGGTAGSAGDQDSGTGGTSGSCVDDVDCDDKLFCNGKEHCNAGTCEPGTPAACNDGIDCTEDYCDQATDKCAANPSDQKCSDGLFCNGAETCNPSSGCEAGVAVTCDDSIACTADGCDEATKACAYVPDDTGCQNGSFCDGKEVCTPGVGCEAGAAPDCDDQKSCTIDSCSDTKASCEHAPNDQGCDDGLVCDGTEACDPSNALSDPLTGCVAGTALACADEGVACTNDACDETAKACVHVADNGNCGPGEFCVPGQSSTGCTVAKPCTNASECDDGDLCNGVETCNVVCMPGTPVDCADAFSCTVDACNPLTGLCTHTPKNSVCNDGLKCNGNETCSVTVGCKAGTPVNCDDKIACTIDSCSEPTGTCVHTPFDPLCDDGKLCNGKEVCGATGCTAGAPYVCPSDGVACTNDVCDVALDACTYVADDTKCACGQTCNPVKGGCGNWCEVTKCSNGKVYACGDCVDNDGDCAVDGKDTQCLGPCDPREDSGPSQGSGCYYAPPPGQFQPELDCAWNGPAAGQPYQAYNDVVMTPVVANLTDDNGDGKVNLDDVPDIAFVSYRLQEDGCCNVNGVLRVISGRCNGTGMTLHYSVGGNEVQAQTGTARWLDNTGGLAVGDIDNDGFPEIVGTINGGGTIAFEHDGKVKWVQAQYPKSPDHLAGTQPSIADLDADGKPEIIQGRVVLNGLDGSLKWKGTAGTGINGFLGPVSTVADPDLDGKLNVLAGNTMYDHTGAALWTKTFALASTASNCGAGTRCDGFTATGNFDADDQGEVVIVRIGQIHILNHDGSYLKVNGADAIIDIPKSGCSFNEGGPPTIADFDGDGHAEIGVAGANYYVVADLDCIGMPLPAGCDSQGIRWKVANNDCSSRVTGSSVFDFDGDGNAEVIYNDETYFRMFDGTTGATLLQVVNHSHTRLEMPIVADVDNDGNAEIVFIENANGGGTTQGIRVWSDKTDSWVATRRIWNQHSYHVTNVSETGAIPKGESPNWLYPSTSNVSGKMNNFRQNLPEFDVLSAPDLSVTVTSSLTGCPDSVILQANVCNKGDLQVGPGVPVTFWDNATQAQVTCTNGATATTKNLSPGQCELVSCNGPKSPPAIVVGCVDNVGPACLSGGNNECVETNNSASVLTSACPQQ